MVEFRTRALGQEEDSSGSSLEKHLETVWQNIQNDPELKKRLLKEAADNDVDPTLLRALFGDDIPNENELQQNMATEKSEPETVTKTEKPEAEQVIGFLDEVIDLAPEDMTLSELKEWCDENKDIVDTAIQMRF